MQAAHAKLIASRRRRLNHAVTRLRGGAHSRDRPYDWRVSGLDDETGIAVEAHTFATCPLVPAFLTEPHLDPTDLRVLQRFVHLLRELVVRDLQ